jgi:hypothetical protein
MYIHVVTRGVGVMRICVGVLRDVTALDRCASPIPVSRIWRPQDGSSMNLCLGLGVEVVIPDMLQLV